LFENRSIYRHAVNQEGLKYFSVSYKETETYIGACRDLSREALSCIMKLRRQLDEYISGDERFLKSLEPVEPMTGAPEIAVRMCEAAKLADVGPMAAVAGAFSQYIGEALLRKSPEVIVENGGDIFIATKRERTVAVYAGSSPLSMKVAVKIPGSSRLGICTSAGTVGPSLSFGKADAAMVVSENTLLADAAASALGNAIQTAEDIRSALETVIKIKGVVGALAIKGETLGAIGELSLIQL
jgi:ApbE superfamily uncharacterized protein (UPF0280 family)